MQNLKDYKDAYEVIFQGIKLIVEILLMVVTIAKGFGALKKYVEEKRNNQVLEYMKTFSEKERKRRLGSVNGLVHYSAIMFKELFYLCAFEKDILIRGLLWDALMNICCKKKQKCKQLNNFLVRHSLRENVFICNIKISQKRNKMWDCLRYGDTNDQKLFGTEYDASGIIYKNDKDVEKCLSLSAQLMSGAFKRAFLEKLNGVIFWNSSLKNAHWYICVLKNSVLLEMEGLHARGAGIRVKEIFLWKNNFIEAYFLGICCKALDIYDTKFQQSTLKAVSLQGARYVKGKPLTENEGSELEKVSLNVSQLCYVKVMFYHIKESHWNNCELNRCNFYKVDFAQNKWHNRTACYHSRFRKVNFFGGELCGKFEHCTFEIVEWSGSNLQGCVFKNCTFNNIKFYCTDMKNVKFIDCIFDNLDVLFQGTENMDLNNITWEITSAQMHTNKEQHIGGTE